MKSRSHPWAGFNQITCQDAIYLPLSAERGTHPLSGRPALQFHLLQVGGSKGHVVVNEVRDQRRGSVVLCQNTEEGKGSLTPLNIHMHKKINIEKRFFFKLLKNSSFYSSIKLQKELKATPKQTP